MPLVSLTYDISSGSNTAASGTNAPSTAVTGTNGDISGTTFTLNETVDFTGVADDDSDVLWVDTPSGDRHLFRITAFNPSVAAATTLTVSESATSPETGDNWAVGGVRQHFWNDTSNSDVADMTSGWEMIFEAGTYTISNSVLPLVPTGGNLTDGRLIFRSSSGDPADVTWAAGTASVATIEPSGLADVELRGLTLTNTGSAAGARVIYGDNATTNILIKDCIISGPVALYLDGSCRITGINSEFTGTSTVADSASFHWASGRSVCYFNGCRFLSGAGHGAYVNTSTGFSSCAFLSCAFYDNDESGLRINAALQDALISIENCVFHDNAEDGIVIEGTPVVDSGPYAVINSAFTSNGGYGINYASAGSDDAARVILYADYNAYGNNTSGALNNAAAGPNDVTLTGDPYVDASTGDFTLDETAGQGAAMRDAGLGLSHS